MYTYPEHDFDLIFFIFVGSSHFPGFVHVQFSRKTRISGYTLVCFKQVIWAVILNNLQIKNTNIIMCFYDNQYLSTTLRTCTCILYTNFGSGQIIPLLSVRRSTAVADPGVCVCVSGEQPPPPPPFS